VLQYSQWKKFRKKEILSKYKKRKEIEMKRNQYSVDYLNNLSDEEILKLIPTKFWKSNLELFNFDISTIRQFGYCLPFYNLKDGNDYVYDIGQNEYFLSKERD
jgi:hypothetical protein